MAVKVEFFNTLRAALGGVKAVEVEGVQTLRDVMQKLEEMFPGKILGEVWDGEKLNEDYLIMINGRNVVFMGGIDAPVKDGDEISLFPPAAGG